MKAAYPAANQQNRLNDSQLALKIARHSPCSICNICAGLHPAPNIDVVLDELPTESSLGDLGQYGSDDEDAAVPYLQTCACGHDVYQHGADESDIGPSEFARRSRVAIRLDELLQDVGKLLDFGYVDEDITSLRRQMRLHFSLVSPTLHPTSSPEQLFQSLPLSPASSDLSDPPQPPNKKRRVSTSSLSDAEEGNEDDEEDEEEDRPLAARMSIKTSGSRSEKSRAGKRSKGPGAKSKGPGAKSKGPGTNSKGPAKSKKAHTAPTSLVPPVGEEQAQMNGKTNGINGQQSKVKVEDMMDEDQLTRLAAGVTVDTASRASAGPPIRTEKAATIELRKGVIQITPVENDKQPRSLVILTGLKTLFQKQLPNMPREYIARLVYDSNSRGLAIIKRGYKVVGGICFRPFPHRGFAEIVFFATASADQEKGYGGMLMDHFKTHIKKAYPGMMHFLTYADNYAVGYFEKQGFTKDITLDRSVWAAYIKDYEGGTIMQCTMLRKVDYLDKANIIAQQQEAVMMKIRQMSKSHIVYPGLSQFQAGAVVDITVDPKDVPGLRESGWSLEMAMNERRIAPRSADNYYLERLLRELRGHPQAWPFQKPVDGDEVVDYYDVIKNPMDLSTMEHKLETDQYKTVDAFIADAQLVFDNCRLYNPEHSIYARNATKLEKFFKDQILDQRKREG